MDKEVEPLALFCFVKLQVRKKTSVTIDVDIYCFLFCVICHVAKSQLQPMYSVLQFTGKTV